ncbi:MAG: beta-propeller fold lactonase family protein [Terracidiphilus sp.]|nr:beta-propeller fold lactonase family protein [Terracidiphilus sp.]
MKSAKWAWVLLLASMPLLNGCAGFWDAPSSDTTTTTTLSSGVFYVLNIGTSQIVAYYVSSGTLTKVATYSTPATPITLTVSPSNNFLYLSTANGIYLYTISSSGTLTLGNSSSVISSDLAYSMQVDSGGEWLVEAVSGAAYVYAIPISTSTGKPTSTTEQYLALPGSSIQQLTISPDNSYVFVAMGTAGTEAIPFTYSNTNPFGAGTNIAVTGSGGAALSVAVDPSDRLLYIGETAATSGTNTGGLRVFKFSTLAEISGSPYGSGGLAPYSILPISTGSYVYVANRQTASGSTGLIKGFTVASSSGTYTLTALGSTFSSGTHTVALAEDSTDQFVFAASIGGSYDLTGYVFDSSSAGTLDTVIQSTTGTDPVQAGAIAAAH